jgi:hypothetical protein
MLSLKQFITAAACVPTWFRLSYLLCTLNRSFANRVAAGILGTAAGLVKIKAEN